MRKTGENHGAQSNMSGGPFVVVLDLNGILADVRRREAAPVLHRKSDVVLPNGQKAYMHPHCLKFLHAILALDGVRVVLYTSRLKHNSEPIERLLSPYISQVAAVLHGEECDEPDRGAIGSDRFHPIKTIGAVVDALIAGGAHRSNDPMTVIFLDDNPHRIRVASQSLSPSVKVKMLRVGSYDATQPSSTDVFLADAWRDLRAAMHSA